MNDIQKRYAEAKAVCDAVAQEQKENEAKFIQDSGYKNPDGSIPKVLYQIEDDSEFDRLCEEYEASTLNVCDRLVEAERVLRDAEDKLIDYGLSLAPKNVREVLGARRDVVSVREKLIDLAFRLDTRTLPRGLR